MLSDSETELEWEAALSVLKYDGGNHLLELVSSASKSCGKWSAYNNIDKKFANAHYGSQLHLSNGTYAVQDTKAPFAHKADANGPYGLLGIIRFAYPGHAGVGVHSGRANAAHNPGPQHATHGCIRTTDAAMALIKDVMAKDPLTSIEISGNDKVTAVHGKVKNHVIVSAGIDDAARPTP